MVVELINQAQFVRAAGLHPAPPYSRVVVLTLFTDAGGANMDQQDSGVLASEGIIHRIEVHAEGRTVNQPMDAVLSFGINRESEAVEDGPPRYRQKLIDVYGGTPHTLIIQGVSEHFELEMGVRFVGDKTRLGAIAKSASMFDIRFQLLFTISEG
jgi:hypothetical protein